ncbi:IS1595 family transposase [Flavobacterium sp. UBA7680]|uniref:IS1595 family transposase n=1 Tax=Flavobacterium sp. UBA7680 TaxID=1946559 RepID=UPI0025C5AB28|nr:IS1595 family transposase [Flavobacterium sp. UBA7680]
MFNTNFKSVIEIITTFSDEQKCIAYLEQMRWEDGVVSPFDENSKVYKCKGNKYRCKNTGKYFNVRTNTLFDNTKVELQKWFLAIYLVTSHKKGISSVQLAKDINVTQKTSWFMLMRIRACFGIENYNELEGVVECDESFYGGKNINRHKDKKVEKCQGRSFKDKTPILGMMERGGKLNCIVVNNTQKSSIQPLVKRFVSKDTHLITDEWHGYTGLNKIYKHDIVNHAKKEYVNLNDSSIHSNGIEGTWKIMKNSLRDMYNFVSRKHLQLYVDEHVYRFNMRKHVESDKFNWLLFNSAVRTKYVNLINE